MQEAFSRNDDAKLQPKKGEWQIPIRRRRVADGTRLPMIQFAHDSV
jgi:hypothetical protein